MAFLDKAGLQTLTNKLVQGDAIKVASSRGNTVKNVIDNITRECSDVENPQTMALEDETGHFMIGKGKDIDVSGDVEAGKMAFGFKGSTLHNVADIDFTSRRDFSVSSSVDVEDGWLKAVSNGGYTNFFSKKFPCLKPSSQYTFILEIKEYSLKPKEGREREAGIMFSEGDYRDGDSLQYLFLSHEQLSEKNYFKILLRSNPDLTHKTGGMRSYLNMGYESDSGNIALRYMLLEGDWTNKEVPPFFTGIKSSFETEEERKIVHTGKNL